MITRLLISSILITLVVSVQYETINNNVVFENVDRLYDLSSQIAKIINKITVKNDGPNNINHFLFSTERDQKHLSMLTAQVVTNSKNPLKIVEVVVRDYPNIQFYKVILNDALQPGETITLEVSEFWTSVIFPHPQQITQKEKQLVKFVDNVYLYSPYKINKLSATLMLHTRNVESSTKLKQSSINDGVLTYGPFTDIKPFSSEKVSVHYENTSPFLQISNLLRVIEISHWGNIAVEETVELVHTGAKLKGPFSRYDYQRESGIGQASVKSFKMILPAAAVGTYYRDDIGNISTSYMRIMKDAVELEIRPRFPLFGGWKTSYTIGYNVPSYEYLYNSDSNYVLKMRLLDHVFDDMVVDKLTTKIILPEGVKNIQLTTPYSVKRLPDTLHYTYLDTRGRTVITLFKSNLIDNHIQDFLLRYEFSSVLMLQEPLLVIVVLYTLFLLMILYVRLDFSITKDTVGETKMRVAGYCEKIMVHQDKRTYLYNLHDSQIAKLKATKDVNAFTSCVRSINTEHKAETSAIAELAVKLKPDAPDIFEKIQEIQKFDKMLKDMYAQHQTLYTDKFIYGKINRSAFVDAENSFLKKRNDIMDTISNLCRSLE